MQYLRLLVVPAWVVSLTAGLVHCQDFVTLRIMSGDFDRQNTPIVFSIPEPIRGAQRLELVHNNASIDFQWYDREKFLGAVILPGRLPARASSVIQLNAAPRIEAGDDRRAGVSVRTAEDGSYLSLHVGTKDVLRYPLILKQPPSDIDPVYAHSGHIHPLFTPSGRIVTAEFPADHPHQHGIFNAWVNTTFEGRKVDFWNQKGLTGTVEHVRVINTIDGPVFGQFTVELAHLDLSGPAGRKPVLREYWTVRAWNIDDTFLIDLESRQTCIADSPLTVNEYHYGGMTFRGPESWLGKTASSFHTSEGKSRDNGNHTRPKWTAISGQIDGHACSVTVMGHAENFRYPVPVRLHPDKPYFVFTPPQLGAFDLEPGKEFLGRYRYLVADTAYDAQRAEQIWNDYVNPPSMAIEP